MNYGLQILMGPHGEGGHELSEVVNHKYTMVVWQYLKFFKRFVDTFITSCKFILQI